MNKLRLALVALFAVSAVFAASVEINPTYVRIPINGTQTFQIKYTGAGKIYDITAYGPDLSWDTKRLWVGAYGKDDSIMFFPQEAGTYEITIEMDGERDSAEVDVYTPSGSTLGTRIRELRSTLTNSEDVARLNEVERLYNQSRFELAEIRLNDLLEDLSERMPEESGGSRLPNILLIFLLLVAAVLVAKAVM